MDSKLALKQLKVLEKHGKKMRLAADGWKNHWQTLIATALSARTRDEVTIEVCKKMFSKYPNAKSFSKLNLTQVKKLIKSINFYNNKAKNILACSKEIVKKYDGKVPKEFDKLVELPGIGRKTANVFLAEYGGDNIGVDTHVNYISNYLGWANSTKPEKVEESLKKLFPKRIHKDLNWTMVRFGKTYTSKMEKDGMLDKIKCMN